MYKKSRGRKRFRPLYWLRQIVTFFAWLAFWLWVLATLFVVLLRFVPPPTTSFMVQTAFRNGPYTYQWQPYERISPEMALAAIASEDQRFPTHRGFDVDAINAVIRNAESLDNLRGASTITQQVAKNLFLWPGRSFIRKGVEFYLTAVIELTWSKQRILEMYLNIAQFGDNTFGVEAASRQFFQGTAQSLTAEQAALSPPYSPAQNSTA